MTRHVSKRKFSSTSFLILLLHYARPIPCTVTTINSYDHLNEVSVHKTPEIKKSSHRISTSGDNSSDNDKSLTRRSDKVGNVIFSDNFDFSTASAPHPSDSVRNKKKNLLNDDIAGGFLRNHRLEVEEPLSPEIASSATAAAIATFHHGFPAENDLKIANDNVHTAAAAHHTATSVVRGAGASVIGAGQSRSLLPGEGFGGHNGGWASNSGNCLFSCASAGSFGHGPPVSCCQLNYVQCCPNPHHEQWNFKNLHHGRGNFLGSGSIAKSGYGWGNVRIP